MPGQVNLFISLSAVLLGKRKAPDVPELFEGGGKRVEKVFLCMAKRIDDFGWRVNGMLLPGL